MRLTIEDVKQDIRTAEQAIVLLRIHFRQTQDITAAQTIVNLMETKDHLNQILTEVSGQLATSEPADDCPVINLHDSCASSESVDK